jgi:hypothetical protein
MGQYGLPHPPQFASCALPITGSVKRRLTSVTLIRRLADKRYMRALASVEFQKLAVASFDDLHRTVGLQANLTGLDRASQA